MKHSSRRRVSVSDLAAETGLAVGWLRSRLISSGRIVPERVSKELLIDRAEALRAIAELAAAAAEPSHSLPRLTEFASARGADPIALLHVLRLHRAVFQIGADTRVDALLATCILNRHGGQQHVEK